MAVKESNNALFQVISRVQLLRLSLCRSADLNERLFSKYLFTELALTQAVDRTNKRVFNVSCRHRAWLIPTPRRSSTARRTPCLGALLTTFSSQGAIRDVKQRG
jgi:hypothetical protein